MNTRKYYLVPNDCHKSFYGKAVVEENENGSKTLFSYNVKIMTILDNGNVVKHWNGYTATTQRHIRAFSGLDKKSFALLPVNVETSIQ